MTDKVTLTKEQLQLWLGHPTIPSVISPDEFHELCCLALRGLEMAAQKIGEDLWLTFDDMRRITRAIRALAEEKE